MVTVKNYFEIWEYAKRFALQRISEAVAVRRSINCFFYSAVNRPLSIDIYGIIRRYF